jgi:hypothetical protein
LKAAWYPTRLLDVGEVGKIRIIETYKDPPTSPYMTLSHCWGSVEKMPLRLLKDNYNSLMEGMPVEKLPKTFQDSVCVCHRLDIRYLWIDSLCIIQDQPEDWARECTLMANIYSNSHCTIAASAALDSAGGLFRKRCLAALNSHKLPTLSSHPSQQRHPTVLDPPEIPSRRLSWEDRPTTPNTISKVSSGRLSPKEYLMDDDVWNREIDTSHLNNRGWVAQERILSPRILFFGETQVFWHCSYLQACETFPIGRSQLINPLSGHNETGLAVKLSSPFEVGTQVRKGSQEEIDLFERWRYFIVSYSYYKFTFSSDRLIALAGVAQRMASMVEDTYVAGLWKDYLHVELLWRVDHWDTRGRRMRGDTYIAPTFSWASVNSAIKWPDLPLKAIRTLHPSFTVEDITIEGTSNSFGTLSSGSIRVKARLKSCTFSWLNKYISTGNLNCYTKLNTSSSYEKDRESDCMESESDSSSMESDVDSSSVRSSFDEDMVRVSMDEHPVYYLLKDYQSKTFYYFLVDMSSGLFKRAVGYLLLEHVNAGVFKRVGVIEVDRETRNSRISLEDPTSAQEDITCEAYDATEHMHTFCIK